MGKGVFGFMTVAAAGVIYVVHWQQENDKAEMHKGVLRDKERRRAKEAQKKEAQQGK
jgi:protein PET117